MQQTITAGNIQCCAGAIRKRLMHSTNICIAFVRWVRNCNLHYTIWNSKLETRIPEPKQETKKSSFHTELYHLMYISNCSPGGRSKELTFLKSVSPSFNVGIKSRVDNIITPPGWEISLGQLQSQEDNQGGVCKTNVQTS